MIGGDCMNEKMLEVNWCCSYFLSPVKWRNITGQRN